MPRNLRAKEASVDWIEKVFHVSPDGGNGFVELAIYLALFAVVAAAVSGVRSARRWRAVGRARKDDQR